MNAKDVKALEALRQAAIQVFDAQFPIEMFDEATEADWSKIIEQRLGYMIYDYIMRNCLGLDEFGITPNDFQEKLEDFLYDMDVVYGINFMNLKEDILSEKQRIAFLLTFSEIFFPVNTEEILNSQALGKLKGPTAFFGWIKESLHFFGEFAKRLSDRVNIYGPNFKTYSFMDWSPQKAFRLAATAYNIGILQGSQSTIRQVWNNYIDTSHVSEIPYKGREMDMLSILFDDLSYTSHVKTQREFTAEKVSERINSVIGDYWSSLIVDGEIFSATGTIQEQSSGVFRAHEADIATTLNYVGDLDDLKAISVTMAKKLLSIKKSIEISSRTQNYKVQFKSPLDLNIFYAITDLINKEFKDVDVFDENDIRGLFSTSEFESKFIEAVRSVCGSRDKFNEINNIKALYEDIRNIFISDFDKLFQKMICSDKIVLVWDMDVGNYLLAKDDNNDPIPLTTDLLPDNIKTLDQEGNWDDLPTSYNFQTQGVHVVISRYDENELVYGILPLSRLIELDGKLPDGVYMGYYDPDTNTLYRNAIITDQNGKLLNGLVSLDILENKFVIENEWYDSQVEENIVESDGVFTLENAYRALILSTGDQVIIMFQEQIVNFVPIEPFKPLFSGTTIVQSSIKILKQGLPHIELISIAPYKNSETYNKLDGLLDVVYQFSNAYELYGALSAETTGAGQTSHSFNFVYLFNYEKVLGLHKDSRTLPDGTTKFYAESYFKEVLENLNPDKEFDLSKLSWFFIKDGQIEKANNLKMKEFYQKFLDLIRARINVEDILFTEFKSKLDNLNNFDISTNTFTVEEEKLLSDLRNVLQTIFGYSGFTLLQMGIMVFNKINNEFEVDFIIPSYKSLVNILNKFRIRPLNTKTIDAQFANNFLDDLRNRPRVFLSMLFSGQIQLVPRLGGKNNKLYSYSSLDFIKEIFPNYISGIEDSYYHSEAYRLLYNMFYTSFAGRERFGQRIADAKIKILEIFFSDIINTQILSSTIQAYEPFKSMSATEQDIWLELMQMYSRVSLADTVMLPQRYFDPTSILFDLVIGVLNRDNLEATLVGKNVKNKLAKDYKLNFGVLLSKLTKEDIRQIAPALYYTYDHLYRGDITNSRTILSQYAAMTTDHFWKAIEQPILHTVSQLQSILTSLDTESFVIQFRRISHSGINKDKSGFLKEQVYNAQDVSDLKITDYNTHPEIQGTNLLITNEDLNNAELLREKLFSIVYYMVKYQAFIVIKAEDARKTNVVLAATLTKLFTLDYVKSLTSDGNWGTLTLIEESENNYDIWQEDWNRGEIWNDGNAYIPFYLLPDYKSNMNSFMDNDGNVLAEGRLKELFLQRYGVDIEYLTRRLTA